MNKDNLNLDREVENIIKTNGFKIPRDVLDTLIKKYNDNRLVNTITTLVNNKYKEMVSNSIKLADKLMDKGYTFSSKNFNKILSQNKDKYVKKYNLYENTFKEFEALVKKHMKSNTDNEVLPLQNVKSEFNKIFGESYTVDNKSLYIDDNEKPATNNILSLYKNTKNLYNHVFLQSLTYKDCSVEALMAKFNHSEDDVYDAINPVLAALFIPKFSVFEKYTLNANLSRVIHNRYNNIPSDKDYDETLIKAILSDPNETICTGKSKMEDIYRRCNVQVALWNAVSKLRNSICYNKKINKDLLDAVDNCNATDFDTPEFLYFGSEDILLKKILATFSFRPIITRSIPLE